MYITTVTQKHSMFKCQNRDILNVISKIQMLGVNKLVKLNHNNIIHTKLTSAIYRKTKKQNKNSPILWPSRKQAKQERATSFSFPWKVWRTPVVSAVIFAVSSRNVGTQRIHTHFNKGCCLHSKQEWHSIGSRKYSK